MEAWLRLPSDAQVRKCLENLAVDALVGLAGKAGQALLRRLPLGSPKRHSGESVMSGSAK
jgi:hypothetical protein